MHQALLKLWRLDIPKDSHDRVCANMCNMQEDREKMNEPYWAQSKSVEWYTPKSIFDALNTQFDLDVCSPGSEKCHTPAKLHIVPPIDSLAINWHGFVWMNPPFGRNNGEWFQKFAKHGNGIALLPLTITSTKKYQSIVKYIDCMLLVEGRPKFTNEHGVEPTSPPSGIMLIGIGQKAKSVLAECSLGSVWYPLRKENNQND